MSWKLATSDKEAGEPTEICSGFFIIPNHSNNKRVTINSSYTGILLVYRNKLEKAMAPHSSTLAWKIPWTEPTLVGCSPWGR